MFACQCTFLIRSDSRDVFVAKVSHITALLGSFAPAAVAVATRSIVGMERGPRVTKGRTPLGVRPPHVLSTVGFRVSHTRTPLLPALPARLNLASPVKTVLQSIPYSCVCIGHRPSRIASTLLCRVPSAEEGDCRDFDCE